MTTPPTEASPIRHCSGFEEYKVILWPIHFGENFLLISTRFSPLIIFSANSGFTLIRRLFCIEYSPMEKVVESLGSFSSTLLQTSLNFAEQLSSVSNRRYCLPAFTGLSKPKDSKKLYFSIQRLSGKVKWMLSATCRSSKAINAKNSWPRLSLCISSSTFKWQNFDRSPCLITAETTGKSLR